MKSCRVWYDVLDIFGSGLFDCARLTPELKVVVLDITFLLMLIGIYRLAFPADDSTLLRPQSGDSDTNLMELEPTQ